MAVVVVINLIIINQVTILVENVSCRMDEASASQLASVQGRLADGVVSALACAEDPSALQAAGTHVVKVGHLPLFDI